MYFFMPLPWPGCNPKSCFNVSWLDSPALEKNRLSRKACGPRVANLLDGSWTVVGAVVEKLVLQPHSRERLGAR